MWRQALKKNNIKLLSAVNYTPDALWVTHCSRTKVHVPKGTPKEFYVSRRNKAFYLFAETFNLLYGILSDKYGIHFMVPSETVSFTSKSTAGADR